MGLYGTGPGRPNRSRETEQVTCSLEVPRGASMGRVATSVPTAASVAAPELRPSAWPASSLRPSSHERAGLRDTAGRAAPPVRVSFATPGLPIDCKLQRMGRSTDRFFTDPDQDRTRLPPDCPKSLLSDQALLVPFYSSCEEEYPLNGSLTPVKWNRIRRGRR